MIKHHTTLALSIFGIVLAMLILPLFIVWPLLSKIAQTQAAIRANEIKLAQIQAEIAGYKSLTQDLSKISGTRAILERVFPVREKMVSLVEILESSNGRAGFEGQLTLTDRKEKELEGKGGGNEKPPVVSGLQGLEEVPYQLQMIGQWRQFADFLSLLENLPYVTIPESMTFASEKIQAVSSQQLLNAGQAAAKMNGFFYISSE